MKGVRGLFDHATRMFAWEAGELDHEEEVELFQFLIDTGFAWTFQGCYGRNAMALIDSGECHA